MVTSLESVVRSVNRVLAPENTRSVSVSALAPSARLPLSIIDGSDKSVIFADFNNAFKVLFTALFHQKVSPVRPQ